MLQFISPGFDAAGEQFWPPLVAGATIVFPGEERERLGEPLAAFCERHRDHAPPPGRAGLASLVRRPRGARGVP